MTDTEAHGAIWHPVALANAVEPSTSAGIRLFGRELVVWRDDAGRAHVWEDRCPHRGMRLSFGFVRGDHLACLYHGWQYDASGRCRHIPAHPGLEVPATITVPVFRTREWAGMIWATLAADTAGDEPIEDITTTAVRTVHVGMPLGDTVSILQARGLGAATVRRLEDNLCLVKSGGEQLIVALQPVAQARTALHLVFCGTADAAALHGYARDLEAFRLTTVTETGTDG